VTVERNKYKRRNKAGEKSRNMEKMFEFRAVVLESREDSLYTYF
jgi:hypothetical protein